MSDQSSGCATPSAPGACCGSSAAGAVMRSAAIRAIWPGNSGAIWHSTRSHRSFAAGAAGRAAGLPSSLRNTAFSSAERSTQSQHAALRGRIEVLEAAEQEVDTLAILRQRQPDDLVRQLAPGDVALTLTDIGAPARDKVAAALQQHGAVLRMRQFIDQLAGHVIADAPGKLQAVRAKAEGQRLVLNVDEQYVAGDERQVVGVEVAPRRQLARASHIVPISIELAQHRYLYLIDEPGHRLPLIRN